MGGIKFFRATFQEYWEEIQGWALEYGYEHVMFWEKDH